MINNKLIYDNFPLSPLGHPETSRYTEFDEEYKGWKIWLDCPNGEILAVDILHYERELWLGTPTYEEFEYDDDEKIIAHAKKLIDEIEVFLESSPDQLSLFDGAAK